VTCPDTVRGRGDAVPVRYHLSHTATGARAIHWHVRAKRNWPDPQRHGVQVVAAGAQAEIVVPMFIPDTAAAGAGALEMTAWFAGTPGNDATCSAAMATPTTSAESVDRAVGFALGRPRPQPARREAVIALTLPVAGAVRIDVLDVSGRRVQDTRTLKLAAGTHPIPIRAGAGGPSIYLVRATFAGETRDSRVVFLE
jgi:hypothetical protein